MATNIDTALSVQDAVNADHSPHIFTMSNGDLVTIYYNGTNLVWRSKSGGSWSAATTITLDTGVTPPQVSYLTRNGDVIFAVVSKDPIDASHNGDFFQFTYNTATHTLATTNKQLDAADGSEKAAGIGYISGASANNQVQVLHGNAAGSFATVQQLNVNPTIFGTDQVPTMMDYRSSARTGLVTDGTTVNYLIYAIASTGTAFKVERFATSSATDNVESPPAPAANLAGVTAVWDGTNYVFVANENNAKLRYLVRTGTNTYGAWTDILSDASLTGQPAVCVKANGDLAVFYRTNKNQANGEIWVVARIGGTWGSPSLLAGGASTGWSNPSCAASDLNDAGVARVVYVTGTASAWTLVEDAYTIGGGGSSVSLTASAAQMLASAPNATLALSVTLAATSPASAILAAPTASLNVAVALVAQPAAQMMMAAPNATLAEAVALSSSPASLRMSAAPASLSVAVALSASPAVALLSAANATLAPGGGQLTAQPARAVLTAATATLSMAVALSAQPAVTAMTAQAAAFSIALTFAAQAALAQLTAKQAVIGGASISGHVALTDARTASATLSDALVDRASLADARIAVVALSDT